MGQSVEYPLGNARHAWIQVAKGEIELNGKVLSAGDGASVSDEAPLKMKRTKDKSEFLVFDLP